MQNKSETCQYNEILQLYEYCKKIGISATLNEFLDGFVIRFPNGGDVVQHFGSYGNSIGCVEPAIGSRLDYTGVPLKKAKLLLKRHKEQLNKKMCKTDGGKNG